MNIHSRNHKRDCQRIHAIQRGHEHYGLTLTGADLGRIAGLIQAGKSELIRQSTNRITIHRVEYGDLMIWVAYDKRLHSIASVLRPGAK